MNSTTDTDVDPARSETHRAADALARPRVTLVGSFMPHGPSPDQNQAHLERHSTRCSPRARR